MLYVLMLFLGWRLGLGRYTMPQTSRCWTSILQDINWWTGLVWITCGWLWCFYQLFGLVIDRYWFFITDTDTDYLYVYVPDNRYAEPIFIYCYKVQSKVSPFFSFSRLNNNKELLKIKIYVNILSSNYNNKNILFIKSIISNTDINNKQNNVKCFQMEKIKDRNHINFLTHFKLQF